MSGITAPPYSEEMEQAVLGSLLIDAPAIVQVSDMLMPNDFYLVKHQWIYEALLDLGDSADLVTVAQRLETAHKLAEIGGESYLANLTLSPATALNVEEYADSVAQDAARRRMIQACSMIARLAYDRTQDAMQVSAQAISEIEDAGARYRQDDIVPASVAAQSFLRRTEESIAAGNVLPGIPLGLPAVDAVTNGWQPADFDVLAGAPGSGKTSLATQAIYYAAAQYGKHCMLFTLEMPEPQMTDRFISHMSRVPYQKINRPWALTHDEYNIIANSAARFHDLPIWIVDVSTLTPAGALSRMIRHQRLHGLDLAVIDQLQLMASNSRMKDRRLEIVEITRALKLMPKRLHNVPLLVLSQLSRSGYGNGAEPGMADLKESGSIESDADKVIFTYAPDQDNKSDVILKVAKNRKGATMKVSVHFDRATSTFTEDK